MTVRYKPTREDASIIRDCAQRSAGYSRVEICPSTRYNIDRQNSDMPGEEMNIALVSDDPHFGDTDLANNAFKWSDFMRGFPLTEDGRAVLDFWVYNTGHEAELKTNVTAYWSGGRLERVEGTCDGVMWRRS